MAEHALPAARHEPHDVGRTFIWAGASLVLGTTVALALLVLWLFPNAIANRTLHLPLYPEPQLQASPRADMARFYAGEMQWLNGTGWVDKAHGIAHIPIAEAMRQVAQTGIPGWPTPGPGKRP